MTRFPWAAVIVSALLAAATYAVTLGGTFIYDDVPVILLDKRLPDPSLWHLLLTRDYYFDLTTGEGSIDNLYRPLVSLTYALQIYLHGPLAVCFHTVNVLLYAACSALVAMLGFRLAGLRACWVAGVLFAAHPVHAEAVCAIVGRAELLAMLGLVGAVYLHLGNPLTHRRALAVIACAALALGSKEQGMLIPGLLLLAEPLRRKLLVIRRPVLPQAPSPVPLDYAGPNTRTPRLTPGHTLVLGICFLTAFYIVLREQLLGLKFWWDRGFLDPAVQPLLLSEGTDRWLMPLVLLGRYTAQLIFPHHLSFDYSGASIGWSVSTADPHLYLGALVALAGPLALAIALWRRNHVWTLLLGGFALTYGVIANLVSIIGVNYAERLIFTPSVFFILAAALLLARLPTRPLAAIIAALALAGSLHAGFYAARWNNRDEFYLWSYHNQPTSMRLAQLAADVETQRGNLAAAADIAAHARATMPQYWEIWIQSSAIAETRGLDTDALTYMAQAHRLRPQVAAPQLAALKQRLSTRPTTVPATRPATDQRP
jgi:protein O-mannosyl-transferase